MTNLLMRKNSDIYEDNRKRLEFVEKHFKLGKITFTDILYYTKTV